MKKITITLIATLFFLISYSQVRLPAIIGDNMVLQQQSIVPLWGLAHPGTLVVINCSWEDNGHQMTADKEGQWQVDITTPIAGGPYSISVNEIEVSNVFIGEVWFCSGQSNMEWPLQETENADNEIANNLNTDLRLFTVKRSINNEPQNDCEGNWSVCDTSNVREFSAVAYYFGKNIQKDLGVSIGLIHSSWGGTPAEAWTRKEVLEDHTILKTYIERFDHLKSSIDSNSISWTHEPGVLYNGMVNPIIPYKIKGAIWYQGEANRHDHELYAELMKTMIQNWRTDWEIPDFPFYYVQLAPYEYETPVVGAALRDAQRKTLDIVENTGMAVTLDIGNPEDIHPRNKKDVGKRLASLALENTYQKDVIACGPLYSDFEKIDNKLKLIFTNIGSGLHCSSEELTHFEIAGIDKQFYPAIAKIENKSVIVYSENVPEPVAARYAFGNIDEPNLFNKEGFPASSFRTDNWHINTRTVKLSGSYNEEENNFLISMECPQGDADIRYTLDGSAPGLQDKRYKAPISVNSSAIVNACAEFDGILSPAIAKIAIISHLGLGKSVEYISAYHPRYPGSGEKTLIDGLTGVDNFYDPAWQGIQGDDLELIIDLEDTLKISEISVHCLQVVNSWIIFPESIEVFVSLNNLNYKSLGETLNKSSIKENENLAKEISHLANELKARYVKVNIKNSGLLPDWHPGAGNPSWMFIDEIIIK